MPGFLTHYIAGRAVLQGVSPAISEIISRGERLYNLGTQGPDIFFYYFPGHLRKRSRGVGTQMHLGNLGVFLTCMARLAKEQPNCGMKDIIFAYTSGFLMHYALDANAHPYVYARTHSNGAPKIRNSASHRHFETAIDVEMLKLVSGKKPANMKQWELINAEKEHMATAAAALSEGIKEIYNRDLPPKVVHRAMRHMVHLTRLLQSKSGRRKRWMELVENLTIKEPLFSSMVHMQDLTDGKDYLNALHAPWNPPWQENDTHTDSFLERYNIAVEEGKQMLESLYAYVYGNLSPAKLADKIGNRSLKTGLPCEACGDDGCEENCKETLA